MDCGEREVVAVLDAVSRRPRSSYDPLQQLGKRELVQRVRTLQQELEAERQLRGVLAYDQQTLLAKILRLETEIVLIQADQFPPNSALDFDPLCATSTHQIDRAVRRRLSEPRRVQPRMRSTGQGAWSN